VPELLPKDDARPKTLQLPHRLLAHTGPEASPLQSEQGQRHPFAHAV